MARRRWRTVGVAMVVVATASWSVGCAGTTGEVDRSAPLEVDTDAAATYLAAYVDAWNSGRLDRVTRFLADDASLEWGMRSPSRTDRTSLEGWLRGWLPVSDLRLSVQTTFTGLTEAAVLTTATARHSRFVLPEGFDPLPVVLLLDIGPTGIRASRGAWPATPVALWQAVYVDPERDAVFRGVVDDARRFAEAWNAGGAVWPGTRVTLDEMAVTTTREPAVFVTTTGSAAVYTVHSDDGAACSGRFLRMWSVGDSGAVEDERYLWDLAAVRRCGARAGGPDIVTGGWWTSLAPPSFDPVRTGEVALADGTLVPVFDASPLQQQLVTWAIERFALAGLALDGIARFRFPPSERCDDLAGAAVDTSEGTEIHLCYTDAEIGNADAMALTPRRTVVHELAHVWEARHVDEATRSAFMALRGVTVWNADTGDWSRRGSEHAAEIVAWGLLDEPVHLVRLTRNSCAELDQAFRVLTGRPPLLTPDRCAAG